MILRYIDNQNFESVAMKKICFLFICFGVLFASDTNLQNKCNKNDAGACHNLAVQFYESKDYQNAFKYFKKACELKFNQSCFNIGLMSEQGKGTPKDEFKAFDMFSKTCIKNKKGKYNPYFGCANLAFLYLDGRGVRQNFKAGIEILNDTCKDGNLANCEILSNIYNDGYSGITKDTNKAMEILEFSCKKGEINACLKISNNLLDGNITDQKKIQKGISMLENVCKLKNSEACLKLGIYYTNGNFVKQNLTVAKEFFGIACDLRNEKGCQSYKILNENGVK